MSAKPDIRFGLRVLDEFAQRDNPRSMADVMRVHCQHQGSSFCVCNIEFILVHLQHFSRIRIPITERIHERRVIQNPVDWQFDETGRNTIGNNLVRPVVCHQ